LEGAAAVLEPIRQPMKTLAQILLSRATNADAPRCEDHHKVERWTPSGSRTKAASAQAPRPTSKARRTRGIRHRHERPGILPTWSTWLSSPEAPPAATSGAGGKVDPAGGHGHTEQAARSAPKRLRSRRDPVMLRGGPGGRADEGPLAKRRCGRRRLRIDRTDAPKHDQGKTSVDQAPCVRNNRCTETR